MLCIYVFYGIFRCEPVFPVNALRSD